MDLGAVGASEELTERRIQRRKLDVSFHRSPRTTCLVRQLTRLASIGQRLLISQNIVLLRIAFPPQGHEVRLF